jgi:hypothetical protein
LQTEIVGVHKIVAKTATVERMYYMHADVKLDITETAHLAVGHGGCYRLRAATAKKVANITIAAINLLLSMGEVCNAKRAIRTTSLNW